MTRRLHAGAWWLWAGGLLVAAAQTTNPLLSTAIIAVSGLTVAARRGDAGWARGYRAYLLVALLVVALRVVFRILLGGDVGGRTLFTLPRLAFPPSGSSLGGEVTLEEMLAGLYDGLRLAAIVVCVGAANTLADPRRLAASLPRAAGALATAAVVALSLAPQLVESLVRVRRARRLRGEDGGSWRTLRSLLVPVLEDTLHRALALAASMESRGYGRSIPPQGRRGTRSLIWGGLTATCAGMFLLLTSDARSAAPLLGAGLAACWGGLYRLGQTVGRSRYRPDPWGGLEWLVASCGMAAAVGVWLAGMIDPGLLHPSLHPAAWPVLTPPALAAIATASLPAWGGLALPRRSSLLGRTAS